MVTLFMQDPTRLQIMGEPEFCTYFNPPYHVCGLREIDVSSGNQRLSVCRECARNLIDRIQRGIDVLDAADAYGVEL
jgi:hypothetical protein